MRHDSGRSAGTVDPVVDDASVDDIPALLALDDLCFPPGDDTREPAAAREIEDGVAAGHVRVVRVDGEIAAFLQYELPMTNHVYISGVGVRPTSRRQGFAALLLDDLLTRINATDIFHAPSISTVTGPKNLAMIGVLLSRGFVVRGLVPDYFGPGRDRYYCQYRRRSGYVDPDERYLIPVTASAQVAALLERDSHSITALVRLPAGPAFEVSRLEKEDLPALLSSETAAGIAFSGAVLASITFVLGLSFASAAYPDGVRLLLMGAALATTASLIVYANTNGELARLRTSSFSRYTKWGNVLSEFGGVFPFLISLPVAFAKVTASAGAAAVVAVIFGAALLGYDRSTFSISSRFRQSLSTSAISVAIATTPALGVLAVHSTRVVAPWCWTALVTVLLVAQSVVFLYRRADESPVPEAVRRWRP